jgi:hypothetical protein
MPRPAIRVDLVDIALEQTFPARHPSYLGVGAPGPSYAPLSRTAPSRQYRMLYWLRGRH